MQNEFIFIVFEMKESGKEVDEEVAWKITASRLGAMNLRLNKEFILNSNLHKKKKEKLGEGSEVQFARNSF
jgi:hypothetical protein